MNRKIQNDKYEIVNSGSVILPKDDYIEFTFENLVFRITCKQEKNEDGTLPNSRFKSRLVKDDKGNILYFELSIYNVNGNVFAATEEMLGLAFISERPLKLNFAINEVSDSNYLFVYTWYLLKEKEVNENEKQQ